MSPAQTNTPNERTCLEKNQSNSAISIFADAVRAERNFQRDAVATTRRAGGLARIRKRKVPEFIKKL
jgi:hypothetical protein